MARRHSGTGLGGFAASLLVCGALAGLALPTASLALGGVDGKGVSLAARGSFASFTPASISPELARILPERASAKSRLMRFTPAGAANRPDRSVTVAIRVDDATAKAISVRTAIAAARGEPGNGPGITVLAPTRFNLGVARGYRSFAQTLAVPELQHIEMPDLSTFKPGLGDAKNSPVHFNARIAMEDKSANRTLGGIEPVSRNSVDVGGSYRLMRNLDVTAGVRYSQQRDRLMPLTDGRKDNQAVYVGTQFRF